MKIKFINHACFVVESSGQRIMCDPWFNETVFDNGWSLVHEVEVPAPQEYDYVWISHEHPDHFRPSLFLNGAIPNEKKIILQQRTKDKKLLNWFNNKKYSVLEVPNDGYLKLDGDFNLSGDLNYDFDSWVCFKSGDKTILNLNDCISFKTDHEIQQLKDKVGHVDLLMVQFSFANWTGNRGDLKTPQKARNIILKNLKRIFDVIKPSYILPFASFVYFSHEENFYLNSNSIKIDDFVDYFSEENIVVMKPGDQWDISEKWTDNSKNINFWKNSFNNIDKTLLTKTKTASMEQLEQSFLNMKQKIHEKNDMSAFAAEVSDLHPCKIFLTDLAIAFSFDILSDFKKIPSVREECDISMSSESLLNVMKNSWGFGTLMINGRFQANYENFHNFVKQTRIDYMNNIGKYFPKSIKAKDITDSPSLINTLVG